MAPRGYTLNPKTGKFSPPRGSTTMAARSKTTLKRSGTNTTASKKKRKGR